MAIGLRERVKVSTLESVIVSILDGNFSQEYITELIAVETSGKSRADNLNRTMRRMTIKNPLLPFIQETKQEFKSFSKNGSSRSIIFVALFCSSYELFYDMVSLLGKFFHVQEEVPTELIRTKLCQKYGSCENVSRGLCCALGMLVDAGLISRTRSGIYKANRQLSASDYAKQLYRKAFLMNNPTYTENDQYDTHPYFEFI